MSDVGVGEPVMSAQEFSVAYLREEDDHTIDVQTLAPALLAVGKLLREANAEFNGKRATSRVLVVSDFEHKCFNINFELIIGWYEQIKTLLGTDQAKSAKDVLEWVGIVTGPPAAGLMSYLAYLRWKRGRKVAETRTLTDATQTGVVEVRIEGEHNTVHIHQHVHALSENPRALRATRDAFLPLGTDGFDSVRLMQGDVVTETLDWDAVKDIVASCSTGIEESKETEPEIEVTPAWLSVYSPVYDADAPMWRFRMGMDVIYADITETAIAAEALERGGAMVEDTYQVRLEVTTEVDAHGKKKEPTYKILEVIRFVPANPSSQGSLFDDDPKKRR